MTRSGTIAVALAVLGTALAMPVDAGLCVKLNGTVVARDGTCRRKEADFAVVVLPPGDAGAPGAAGATQPRLRAVDANGRRLPGVLNTPGELVYADDDVMFGLDLRGDGAAESTLIFEAADCAGEPLVFAAPGDLYAKARVQGGTAYYAAESGTTREILSARSPMSASTCAGLGGSYDAGTGLCCHPSVTMTFAAPAFMLDLRGFVPPFRVEVEE